MEVLSGPWADLALLFRQTVLCTKRQMGSFPPAWLFCLLLFLSVCVLLLQLISYLSWKLRQVEAELTAFPQEGSGLYRPFHRNAHPRRRSVAQQLCT